MTSRAVGDVWFTADTHFGHRAMVEKGWRPSYRSVAEMDADLIERWNETVRPGDTVWHLGDFALTSPARCLPILERLHGTIHLVAGNHDPVWPGHRDAHKRQPRWLAAGFASIQAFARRRIGSRSVLLSHFPYRGDHTTDERYGGYRLPDTGLALLHGHVHTAWKVQGREVNVGVDVWDCRPVHLDDVATALLPYRTPRVLGSVEDR